MYSFVSRNAGKDYALEEDKGKIYLHNSYLYKI